MRRSRHDPALVPAAKTLSRVPTGRRRPFRERKRIGTCTGKIAEDIVVRRESSLEHENQEHRIHTQVSDSVTDIGWSQVNADLRTQLARVHRRRLRL